MDLTTAGSNWDTSNNQDLQDTILTGPFHPPTRRKTEMFNTGTEFEMDDTQYENAYNELRYLRVVIINTFSTWETKAKVGRSSWVKSLLSVRY